MTSIIFYVLLTISFASNVGNIDVGVTKETIKKSSEVIVNDLIEKSIDEAVSLFEVSERDIRSFIHIESSFRPWIKGTSGEFGLMQILPGEFDLYGPEINKILRDKGLEKIYWVEDYDKFFPRTNILVGAYSYKKRLVQHKHPIWAAMSYNVGGSGARMTRVAFHNGTKHWYCIQIRNTIRRGRQFTYSYNFARRAGRLREWKKMFSKIPPHVMSQFWLKKGDTYCDKLQEEQVIGL
jgi:hypothetical protein